MNNGKPIPPPGLTLKQDDTIKLPYDEIVRRLRTGEMKVQGGTAVSVQGGDKVSIQGGSIAVRNAPKPVAIKPFNLSQTVSVESNIQKTET